MCGIKYIITYMWDHWRSFGFHIEFIGHFNTRLVITLNYSVIADLRTLQTTRAHKLMFLVCYSLLVTARTRAIPLLPCSRPPRTTAPFQLSHSCSSFLLITTPVLTTVENTVPNSTFTFARGLLPRETVCLRSLLRNGYTILRKPTCWI